MQDFIDTNYPDLTYFERIKQLDLVNQINAGVKQDIVDLDDVRNSLQDAPISSLYDEFLSVTGLERGELTEVDADAVRRIYYNWKYSASMKDKIDALNDLAIVFGHTSIMADEFTIAATMANNLVEK